MIRKIIRNDIKIYKFSTKTENKITLNNIKYKELILRQKKMFETPDRQKNQYFLCIMFPNSLFIILLPTIVIIVMIMIIMKIIITKIMIMIIMIIIMIMIIMIIIMIMIIMIIIMIMIIMIIVMIMIIMIIVMIMIIMIIIVMIAITKITYLPVPADPVIVIDGKLTFKGAVKEVVKAEEVEIALNA